MPNTILTPQMITREFLDILHQKLGFVGNINRSYDDSYANKEAKIGDTLRIRLPNQYTVRNGKTLSAQDTTEQQVSLAVTSQKGVDVTFTSAELTLSLDQFSERIIQPAAAVLAANIEADALNMYRDVYNSVGTAGTVAGTFNTFMLARQKLQDSLAPPDKRNMFLTTDSQVQLVDALKGLFQDQTALKQQYKEGMMGRTAGFDWYESTLAPFHTLGSTVTGISVSGASQTGAALLVGGVANTNTFKQGTVFTIANVFAVHPETKAVTSKLQQFVITADVTASTTTVTWAISPSIVTTGALQNVSGSPANSAAITVVGAANTAYQQNLAFHQNAFTFATADLQLPRGVDMAAREVFDGISMRLVRAYDINGDNFPCRLDVLYGYKTIRPQLACRITN